MLKPTNLALSPSRRGALASMYTYCPENRNKARRLNTLGRQRISKPWVRMAELIVTYSNFKTIQ